MACGFGIVQRRAAACIVAGGASDVHVRACVQGVSGTRHVGLWLRLAGRNDRLRGASSPHLPPTSGQALCSTAAGVCKFIMRRESETESESADFFTNPSETVRLPDFENRNNTS